MGIPLARRHTNISYCGLGDGGNKTECENFNLEISEEATQTQSSTSGGGGAGGGGAYCQEKWGCGSWEICQHAQTSLEKGILNGDNFRIISDYCKSNKLAEKLCGYQRRECIEINVCKTQNSKPQEIQACYYSENPTCIDGVKNCHDNDCEFLVDCGGPCNNCATCNDAIQNQFEEGVDCGGPCPSGCISFSSPFDRGDKNIYLGGKQILYLLNAGIFAVLFIILGIKLVKVLKLRRS